MSPRPGRNAVAQAGFPNNRVGWLVASVVLAIAIFAIVTLRGPWGASMPRSGLFARTLGLLFVAVVPSVVLAWAWKRLPRRERRVAPIPIGVLTVLLALQAVAHSAIYAERVRMGLDPARQATASLARGDTTLWAVEDSLGNLLVPPIANRCIINRYGSRVTPGTDGMTVNAAHQRYRRRASDRARQYNETVIGQLRIPVEQVRTFSDGNNCPD